MNTPALASAASTSSSAITMMDFMAKDYSIGVCAC
jgi:hypothetical protein